MAARPDRHQPRRPHGHRPRPQQRLDERRIPHSGIAEAPYGTVISIEDPDGVALESTHVKLDFRADLVGALA